MDSTVRAEIVLVDDEDMVITSVRAFLEMETEHNVHGFTNPNDAIAHLETHPVDVVVSDYLMPQMNGIQLLARSKALQPEAARVLLTGHADKQSAIVAINQVGLYQYLEKPWDNNQLLLVVQSAIERTQLFRSLQTKIAELEAAHGNMADIRAKLIKAFL
ncbi:MAG: response regulator [Acidobacteria bacterium]|nr:response regulator [Acidobacteriota bacterium]